MLARATTSSLCTRVGPHLGPARDARATFPLIIKVLADFECLHSDIKHNQPALLRTDPFCIGTARLVLVSRRRRRLET
jgi:hypothetical protein